MPVVLILVGLMLIVSSVRGTIHPMLAQFGDDAKAFSTWFLLIVVVMLAGKYRPLKPMSDAFMVLIVLAFVLRQGTQVIAGINEAMGTLGHSQAYWKS